MTIKPKKPRRIVRIPMWSFDRETACLAADEVGILSKLISYRGQHGSLPTDDAGLAAAVNKAIEEWRQLRGKEAILRAFTALEAESRWPRVRKQRATA